MKARAWIALVAVYVVWGSTYLAIRFAVETIPPFLTAGIRFLVAGGALYIWQRLSGAPAPKKVEWRSASIIGLLLLLGGNGMLNWAETRIPSGISSLFIGTVPLWMVLFDAFRPNGVKTNRLVWAGVLVGLVGTALLVNPWQSHTSSPAYNPLGIGVLIFAAISWSAGSLYSRKAPLPGSPLLGTGMEMLVGSLGLFVFATILGEWGQFHPAAISMPSLAGLAYLIVFGSGIGFVAYTWLLRNAPTHLVATYAYVNPVVAILLGNLVGHESLEV
ncbi:MAG TPA: EamA family transporter, partial [Anaerolineales bacterium]|nr:EamA family transporter [Anaerolineales bacterium]